MEQVYDCLEVLKSWSDDQKQKFFDGSLKDSNFPTNGTYMNILHTVVETELIKVCTLIVFWHQNNYTNILFNEFVGS